MPWHIDNSWRRGIISDKASYNWIYISKNTLTSFPNASWHSKPCKDALTKSSITKLSIKFVETPVGVKLKVRIHPWLLRYLTCRPLGDIYNPLLTLYGTLGSAHWSHLRRGADGRYGTAFRSSEHWRTRLWPVRGSSQLAGTRPQREGTTDKEREKGASPKVR